MTSMEGRDSRNTKPNVARQFRLFKVYEDGRFEPAIPVKKIPPSLDPVTRVQSKDVVISTSPSISARVFTPTGLGSDVKLPVLYYVHGGSFCMYSAFSSMYTRYLNSLVAQAHVIAVSIEYRLYQESPIPACYEDAWAGLVWVAAHANGSGPNPLLNTHADFERLYVAGDSAGGNIAHSVAARAGLVGLPGGVLVNGLILAHPFFGGTDDDMMWSYMCPTNSGANDPRLKPTRKDLARLGAKRVLLFRAGNDHFGPGVEEYYQELKASGWKGIVELVENKGKDHTFYLSAKHDPEATLIQNRICMFINQPRSSL